MAVTRSVFLTAVFTRLQPGGLLLIVRHKKSPRYGWCLRLEPAA
jgi:predicted methyltransferase